MRTEEQFLLILRLQNFPLFMDAEIQNDLSEIILMFSNTQPEITSKNNVVQVILITALKIVSS